MNKKLKLKALLCCCISSALILSPYATMKSHAASGLNIDAYMDTTYTAIYGVPSSFLDRFPEIIRRTSGYYNVCGARVNISFSSQKLLRTSARVCAENSSNIENTIRNGCKCYTNSQCEKGISHHNNAEIFRNSFSSPTSSNSATWLITATSICGHNGTSGSHHGLNGVAWSERKILTCDYDFKMDEGHPEYDPYAFATKTAIHEIGHLYGVSDHYTILPDQYPDCVWGSNRNSYEIAKGMKTCPRCNQAIKNNLTKY